MGLWRGVRKKGVCPETALRLTRTATEDKKDEQSSQRTRWL